VGLASEDVSVRRSAAWSLFEPAADATVALADALIDPEVRIPAQRALEQIGTEAAAAAPQVTALLEHEDFFVHLGATYELKEIGAPAMEGLREALRDESPHVAYITGKAAVEIGPPAKVLVAELVANLARDKISTTYGHVDGAELAINALGPDAAAVAPRILELYNSGRRPRMTASYISMLTDIGPAARDAIAEHVASDTLDDTQKDELQNLLDALK